MIMLLLLLLLFRLLTSVVVVVGNVGGDNDAVFVVHVNCHRSTFRHVLPTKIDEFKSGLTGLTKIDEFKSGLIGLSED